MTLHNAQILYNKLLTLRSSAIDFPSTVSFKIIHNARELAPIIIDMEESQQNLMQKYNCSLTEEDGRYCYKVPEDRREEVIEELKNLLNTEIDINIYKININDIKDINISPKDMELLYDMIEEED